MFEKLHHILIDLLFAAAGVFSGWWMYHFLRGRGPVRGISGPAFAHTMGNLNNLMVEQNKQISKLSQDLTTAQETIEGLIHNNEVLEKRVKALTEEVERLINIITYYESRKDRAE